MLNGRVREFITRVLPPTNSRAASLQTNNIVPCGGTEAREKVMRKSTQGIHFFQELMLFLRK